MKLRNELKQNIKNFQELANSHLSCSWFQQLLGSALAEYGVLDQAEAYYYKAIEINPNSSVSLYKLGVVLLQQNKLDEAISFLNKAIKSKPDFYKLYNSLGQALEQQGNLDEAINCWQKAIALNPKSCWAYHYLGDAFSSKREWEKAIAYYQKAIALNPRHFWSHYNLGQTFVNSGQPDLAIPCYRYAIKIDPGHVWSYQELASLLKDKGETEEAVTCYKKAIQLNPKEVWFYNDLGQILVQEGQIDEAIDCYQKAIQINSQEPWLHNNLGLALAEKGNLEEAASCCRKAIELKSDDFWLYQHLADILTKKGDLDEAIACCEKAREINPDEYRNRETETDGKPAQNLTSNQTPYTASFYRQQHLGSYNSAREVVPLVLKLIKPKSVVDVGCGVGCWLSVFQENGIEDILGIDGDWVDSNLLEIPVDKFLTADLKNTISINRKFDLVVSVEVAEHIPKKHTDIFLDSLVNLGKVFLFSAAIPFQGGADHVNEQWQKYWVEKFREKECVVVDCIRPKIWDNDNVDWWYAQNILIFVKEKYLKNYPSLELEAKKTNISFIEIVHPKNYLWKA